ncbi:MAG: FHA domain-containing protein [Chloroflexi bacterium]|nr:MAG: FHA domain-containing protein [Chloroflexota bacterium]
MESLNKSPGFGSINFLTGSQAGSTIQLHKPVLTIGREPGNDIVVTDPSVSRRHAQITFNGGVWTISNLTQKNTVTVNRRDVPPLQQALISERDTIALGTGTTFIFLPTVGTPSSYQSSNKAQPAQPLKQSQPATPMQQPVQSNPPSPVAFQQAAIPQQQFENIPPPAASPSIVAQPLQPAVPPYNPTVAVPPPPPPNQPVQPVQQRAPLGGYDAPTSGIENIPKGIPSLEITSNTHTDKPVYPLTKAVISIGRHPTNDIVIKEPVVSAFHAQIVREGGQLIFIHPHPQQQRTTNGLLYMGRSIPGNEPFRKPLERGDIFRIGDEYGTLVTLAYNDGSTAVQDIVSVIRPIPLGAPLISLGRHSDNTVILNHPQVSAHHARLEMVQGGYRIVDLRSTNGVYVNAQRMSNQLLKPGDEVRIGPFKLTYTGTQLTQQDESNSVRIDAIDLVKVGNKQTILLDDISLVIPPRKFVAIVGGSGAGKSMLMDALNGLRPAQKGTVLYNGQDYYKHLAAFSTQLGYVPQEDIIHRDLTVVRALYYAAKLRLPSDFTEAQIKQRINKVLEDVEMSYRRNLLVSKLSGGQRKRVSIALELLANPSVFFLDEPTSGLDPGLDRKMMFLLRKLADRGHTIILVTHATNNINACDYVCFLCQGGRLAFFGPPNDAKTYFEKTDFAEIYSALEPTEQNKNIPQEAEARFKASPYYRQYVQTPLEQGPAGRSRVIDASIGVKPPRRGDPMKQFRLLSMRYLDLLKNDTGNLLILLLQAPVIALILFFLVAPQTFTSSSVATCPPNPQIPQTVPNKYDCQNVVNALNTPQGQAYLAPKGMTKTEALQKSIIQGSGGDAQKILFIMAFAAVMFGVINGAREIVKEEPIYRRERTVNLGIIPYMFSKISVLGVLCLLQSLVVVILVNLKAPFEHSIFLPPVLEIYISLALASLAGLMTGLALSALAPNNDRATSFIPLILIPQVIFSGIIFSLDNIGLQFLGSFFPVRWAMAAMGSTVGLHGDKLGSGGDFAYQGTLFSIYSREQAVVHLLLMWFALIVLILALGFATGYFLKRKDVRK